MSRVPSHHVIVSGTGRSATTFLMQVLTRMDLDTGFPDFARPMEKDWRNPPLPYVIKRPQFCDELPAFLDAGFVVDHAIIPLRNFEDAAVSRRRIAANAGSPNANGGLFGTTDPAKQKEVLQQKFMQLIDTITRRRIPFAIVDYNRINDVDYLFATLKPALSARYATEFTQDRFQTAHAEVTQHRSQAHDGF